MDKADIANDYVQQVLDQTLARTPRYRGASATECRDCGEAIPEKRRQAIAGCRRCAECQSMEELRTRR